MIRKMLFLLILLPAVLFAQEEKAPKFGITFSGFVKSDFMLDSRQTFAAREGHFMLWPMPVKLDANGEDINDGYNTNFLPVQSQLSGKITGPDICGAKTSGVLEGDFFGTTNANTNLLRMRHAFMKLNWINTELLMGQYWHPLFNTSCFPATVSFNTGAPVNPFSRDPQIRVQQRFGNLRLSIAAVEQRDYPSYGPAGGSSSYLRNAAIPELYGELSYKAALGEAGDNLQCGLLFGTKTLVPRLESKVGNQVFKVDESVQSIAASGFIALKTRPVTIKLTGIYGENLSDVLSITGYAVTGMIDTITGKLSYAPTASRIVWADIHTNGSIWQFGVFAGINQATGTTEEMNDPQAPIYGLTHANNAEITSIVRISPRVVYNQGKMRFAVEAECTTATYGLANQAGIIPRDLKGLPLDTEKVSNLRILLAAYYFF
ncbi:MAG: hypothetical protein R6V49_06545 [Bacteroidales bacterium]